MVTPIIQTYSLNEFPRDVRYTEERWERPLKYDIVGHSEENAVLAAARAGIATDGLTMIAAWAACANCARIIIQAGIRRLVTLRPTTAHGKWGASIDIAMTMLEEAGVDVVYLDGSFGVTVRRNGEDVEF
jgi:dCMP deaminase